MFRPKGDRSFGPQKMAPVKVGDELDVTIEAVGEKGDGIAKKDGFVLFVPGAKQGETVKIRVIKVLRKVGFAEKVGAGEAKTEEAPSEKTEQVSEPAPAEETSEDTENFGEEDAEESSEEE